jgi:hypothetical protein
VKIQSIPKPSALFATGNIAAALLTSTTAAEMKHRPFSAAKVHHSPPILRGKSPRRESCNSIVGKGGDADRRT